VRGGCRSGGGRSEGLEGLEATQVRGVRSARGGRVAEVRGGCNSGQGDKVVGFGWKVG
jgi:hypothetical protein